jgi:hypothetical protein
MSESPEDVRRRLIGAGYVPVACIGKRPALKAWQTLTEPTPAEIEWWSRTAPAATNTGVLTRLTPTLDIDVLDPDAAAAVEGLARDRFEERGYVLIRFGRAPKRCIPFRTNTPFPKIVVDLIAPEGAAAKLELLADGQQFIAFGTHPDTGNPYSWAGGDAPGGIKREDLPYLHEAEAKTLVDDATRLLVDRFGYRLKAAKPRPNNGAGGEPHPADWGFTADDLVDHDKLAALAMSLIKSGMHPGAAVNFLRAQLAMLSNVDEDRRQRRLKEIPDMVSSAAAKVAERPCPAGPPSTLEKTLETFEEWLILPSRTPVLAVLGAVAGNLLPGDPVWLGVIAPPSSAKTEILNSIANLPSVVQAATLTAAGLLSGTPRKDRDKGAKGGLLRQIGQFGIIAVKDFGSILSMHPETRGELLAALRELFDGSWTRHLGIDGGRTLHWEGKLGLIFAATAAIDAYYTIIGSLGDRFLFTRMEPAKGQFRRALKHDGAATAKMRNELAEATAGLFAGRKAEPRPLEESEIERLDKIVSLIVRQRGAVERDRRTREMEMILGAEGGARVGLSLARLLAGLDTLGVDRALALDVVESVARDSVPPLRRRAFECIDKGGSMETAQVATALGLPTTTVRRVLEDLAAYGLVLRQSGKKGEADTWLKCLWEQ